jgi:hypothetical protein
MMIEGRSLVFDRDGRAASYVAALVSEAVANALDVRGLASLRFTQRLRLPSPITWKALSGL